MQKSIRSLYPVLVWALFCFVELGGSAEAALKSTKVPRYDAAVGKAVAFLRNLPKVDERDASIVAYALLKAGVDKSEPRLLEGIDLAKKRAKATQYDPYHGTYLAAVDAMLLADVSEEEQYRPELQNIADRIVSLQRGDGSWADAPTGAGDVSLVQYCVLGLWAAQRAGCTINPVVIDRAASYLVTNSNSDGGWRYRPGTTLGHEKGRSSHNMTLAAVGTMSISRLLLFPGKKSQRPVEKTFGVLERAVDESLAQTSAFPGYKPAVSERAIDQGIERGLAWNRVHFSPIPHTEFRSYFYYTLERAASLEELEGDWFTTYGDALLTLQAADGKFQTPHTTVGNVVATSFAILYFMRSTQQILDNLGTGIMKGGRDLSNLFGKKEAKKDIGPLDALLEQMEKADLSALDNIDTDAVVEKIAFGSKEELIGQVDLLKKLLKHPDASNRQTAYFALGRTGDFSLIPEMLQGLRDPNLDVNVEALMALRYISRKPNGFGLSLQPLAGAETADEKRKIQVANAWRTKAFKAWGNWYRQIRPYEEGGGFDELELMANPGR